MASVARHDLHTYTLAELPKRARHVVLTPAVRWRVVVEVVKEIEHDVILDAVLRIRAAGETSPTRIADLLQLPEDLVRNLLVQAAVARARVTNDGRLETGAASVAWIYRDIATGELWPDPAEEAPPLALRYVSPYQARFDRGTAGRPITVECLLMDTAGSAAPEPTSIELARFNRASAEHNRRTAVVSSGEPCLVASPIVGGAIETTRGAPHLTLTHMLAKLSRERGGVKRWLASVPKSEARHDAELPLRQAIAELGDVTAHGLTGVATADLDAVLARVELCLSRFVDQYQYRSGLQPDVEVDVARAVGRCEAAGLSRDLAKMVARSPRGSVGNKAARVLLAESVATPVLLVDFVRVVSHFVAMSARPELAPTLSKLVHGTVEMCERLAAESEGTYVEQAG